MLKRIQYLLVFAVATCSMFGCQEIVELELPNTLPRVVIEGELNYWEHQLDNNGARVRVSTSGGYYDESPSVPVANASVQIEDLSSKMVYDLSPIETDPGLYINNTFPIDSGVSYRLTVDYDNNLYAAQGTVLPVAKLDSFTYRFREATPLQAEGYYFFFSGRTIKERGINYYRFKVYENDSLYNEPEDYLIQSDEFLQERIDTLQLANYAFEVGDSVRIEMYSLNQDIFSYYNQLTELLFNDGGLFSSPPRNPDTNIVNTTNPNDPPLGYFQVSSAFMGGATVEEQQR